MHTPAAEQHFDMVVVGPTPGGIAAAVSAARLGCPVADTIEWNRPGWHWARRREPQPVSVSSWTSTACPDLTGLTRGESCRALYRLLEHSAPLPAPLEKGVLGAITERLP